MIIISVLSRELFHVKLLVFCLVVIENMKFVK
jgi:hypothetical protein